MILRDIIRLSYELDNMRLTRRLLNTFAKHCEDVSERSEYDQYYMELWAQAKELKKLVNGLYGAVYDDLDDELSNNNTNRGIK